MPWDRDREAVRWKRGARRERERERGDGVRGISLVDGKRAKQWDGEGGAGSGEQEEATVQCHAIERLHERSCLLG